MKIRCSDGYVLEATHYEGGDDAVVIAGAMGVSRRFYDAFAKHLAENGQSVVTFDYRGIADSKPASLRGFQGSLDPLAPRTDSLRRRTHGRRRAQQRRGRLGRAPNGLSCGLPQQKEVFDDAAGAVLSRSQS